MTKAHVPAVSHGGSVGKRNKVFAEGFFDRLSDGVRDVDVADLMGADDRARLDAVEGAYAPKWATLAAVNSPATKVARIVPSECFQVPAGPGCLIVHFPDGNDGNAIQFAVTIFGTRTDGTTAAFEMTVRGSFAKTTKLFYESHCHVLSGPAPAGHNIVRLAYDDDRGQPCVVVGNKAAFSHSTIFAECVVRYISSGLVGGVEIGYADGLPANLVNVTNAAGVSLADLHRAAETLHVRAGGLDSAAAPGTAADPFATPQGALDALAARANGVRNVLTLDIGEGDFPMPPAIFDSLKTHCAELRLLGRGPGGTVLSTGGGLSHGSRRAGSVLLQNLCVRLGGAAPSAVAVDNGNLLVLENAMIRHDGSGSDNSGLLLRNRSHARLRGACAFAGNMRRCLDLAGCASVHTEAGGSVDFSGMAGNHVTVALAGCSGAALSGTAVKSALHDGSVTCSGASRIACAAVADWLANAGTAAKDASSVIQGA